MAFDPTKGHAALRRGRSSQPAADYFLTVCTEGKKSGLAAAHIGGGILSEIQTMTVDGTWVLYCAVVMPDHVHLLIALGERLPLSKSVQRLKAKTSAALRSANLRWERGFFDRQLRPGDERLPIFLYIYLNPYRAGLLPGSGKWPYYYCCDGEWAWFRGMLDADRPYPEWLM